MSDTTEKKKLVLFNSSPLLCKGLEYVLNLIDSVEIVGTANSTESAMSMIRSGNLDLIITDVKTPLLDGLSIISKAKKSSPATKILVLTSIIDEEQIFETFWLGADGYCLNDASSEKLQTAVRSIFRGAIWIDIAVADVIRKGALALKELALKNASEFSRLQPDLSGLTAREIEILELLCIGLSNSKIANELSISIETVKTHIRHIMRKLAVKDRTEAAVTALRRHIVQ
jgi:DNA-binding NarL/FixJ family response regulator